MTPAARLFAVASRRPAASDADLLAAWAAGRDADAFAELVRRYGPLVWQTCRATAGDTPAAEDAFQATFLALARRAGHVTATAGFLHRTAGRAARKAARRDRRQPPPPPSPASDDPLGRLIARELLAAVDAEITRLPEGQRLPLLLCGVAGLSTDEAARRLGWSAEAVRGRLQRGRATVRARLAAKGLTVPAVTGLGLVPDRLTAAVMATARGGPVPVGVAKLVPGGLTVGTWLKLTGLVGVLGGLAVAAGLPAAGPPPATPSPPIPTPDPLVLWEGTTDGAGSGVWHPDGQHVVAVGAFEAGDKPHEVRAWDAATGKLAKSFPVPAPMLALTQWGNTLAVSPDGRFVAAGLWRGEGVTRDAVAVYDWADPTKPPALLPLRGSCRGVCFAPVEQSFRQAVLHALGESGRLSAFRVGTDVAEWQGVDVVPETRSGLVALSLTHHPSAGVLAVAQNNRRVSFWRSASLHRPLDVVAPRTQSGPWNVAFTPDGRHMAHVGIFGDRVDVELWDVAVLGPHDVTARPTTHFRIPLDAKDRPEVDTHLAFSPDGRFLAAACRDGTSRVFDTRGGGRVVTKLAIAGGGQAHAAHFHPDGRRLLTVNQRGVRVWDVAAALAAPSPPDLRLTHEKEMDRFAGRWVVSAARADGKDLADMIGVWRDEVAAVDPAVSPKAVNVRRMGGPNAGDVVPAIYEFLDADTCRLCISWDADRRPTAFAAEAGSQQSLLTLKRAK